MDISTASTAHSLVKFLQAALQLLNVLLFGGALGYAGLLMADHPLQDLVDLIPASLALPGMR